MRCMVENPKHEVTVRRIGSGWNVRVLIDGVVNQEMRVFNRQDIGTAARDMLRWEDKVGNISKYADSSRNRNKSDRKPQRLSYIGRVQVVGNVTEKKKWTSNYENYQSV